MDGAGSVESRLQGDFLKFRQSLGKGEIEGAMLESVSILERSRSKEERDPVIEALVRMERALHGSGIRRHRAKVVRRQAECNISWVGKSRCLSAQPRSMAQEPRGDHDVPVHTLGHFSVTWTPQRGSRTIPVGGVEDYGQLRRSRPRDEAPLVSEAVPIRLWHGT